MADTPDLTLEVVRVMLADHGVPVAVSTLWRFFARRPDVKQKTAHASEQERPAVLKRREVWFEAQLDVDPEKLVFNDATLTSTNTARKRGRAPRGEKGFGEKSARSLRRSSQRSCANYFKATG